MTVQIDKVPSVELTSRRYRRAERTLSDALGPVQVISEERLTRIRDMNGREFYVREADLKKIETKATADLRGRVEELEAELEQMEEKIRTMRNRQAYGITFPY